MRGGWLVLCLLAFPAYAQTWGSAQAAVDHWLQGRAVQPQGLTLDVPIWVEDGAFVAVDLTLHDAEPPLTLSLLRSGEDEPRIATLELHAWAAPLRLSTRVRLPQSQHLIVLARDGRGRVWLAAQSVDVLASSCLAPLQAGAAATFGQLQAWADGEHELELRSLLRHPMETGLRPDEHGQLIPQHLPRLFEVNGVHGNLLRAKPFAGLASNPYWRVLLPKGHGPLHVRWLDADGRAFSRQLSRATACCHGARLEALLPNEERFGAMGAYRFSRWLPKIKP